jgi:hypothetical protein
MELPPVNSLVFVKNTLETIDVVEPYWFLLEVTSHPESVLPNLSGPAFQTIHGFHRLYDIGVSWRPAPEIYMSFLASMNLSFDQFALRLFQGGRDRSAGKVGSEVFSWDSVRQAECRGVAQAALELLSKAWADVDSKRNLAHEALRQVQSSQASTSSAEADRHRNSDEVADLGIWLTTHFPKQRPRNSDPIYEAMELLLVLQHRLDILSLHSVHRLGDDSKKD